jgi:hypothetical protein
VLLGTSAVLGDVEDKDALQALFPFEGRVHELVPYLRAQHISLFAEPPAAVVGAPLAQPLAPAGACVGSFDVLQPSPQADGAWRATGWGWDSRAGKPFHRLALVDGSGRVVGIGVSGLLRPDVRRAVRQVSDRGAGWTASVPRGQGGALIAYGLTADGHACEIGRKAWPR